MTTDETDGAHTPWGDMGDMAQHEANDVKKLIQILYNKTGLREEQVREYRALRNKEAEAEGTLDEEEDDAAASIASGPAVPVAPLAGSAFAALVSAVSSSPTRGLEEK
jgi:hypothetical protein